MQTTLKHKKLTLNHGAGFVGRFNFAFYNIAQFLGALNDNLLKFLTVYLLIDIKGASVANDILFLVGVVYVAPFLLFSSVAGILADRFSKQKIIVLLKVAEVIVIGIAFIAYHYRCPWLCFTSVFLHSMVSAFLTPSKYSIIPELVRKEQIPKANGLITSFTYLAIILGTFLASFVTQITSRNFSLAIWVCMAGAIIGLIASLYIPHTAPGLSNQKIRPVFVSQTLQTLKYCRRTPRLLVTVFGSAFFLFLGGFVQLNIVPFAIQSLGLSGEGGGYLFLALAVGIPVGATVAGKLCKKEVDLGLAAFGILASGLTLFGLPLFPHSVITCVIVLSLLGFFGGLFVVPLESYMQAFCSSEIRGQVVAAENFLSFLGILLAPICLYLFGTLLHLSASTNFIVLGVITVTSFFFLLRYLSAPFFSFASKQFVHPFFDLHFIDYPLGRDHQEDKIAFFSSMKSFRNTILLLGESSKFHLFVIKPKKGAWDKFFNFFMSVDIIYLDFEKLDQKIRLLPIATKPLFLFEGKEAEKAFFESDVFANVREQFQLKQLVAKHTTHFKSTFLRRVQITFAFKDLITAPQTPVEPVMQPINRSLR